MGTRVYAFGAGRMADNRWLFIACQKRIASVVAVFPGVKWENAAQIGQYFIYVRLN